MSGFYAPAKIGKGKAVHMGAFASNGTWTLCVANFNVTGKGEQGEIVETEGPITCKRCIKDLAARVERDHAAALAEDLERAHDAALVEDASRELHRAAAHVTQHWLMAGGQWRREDGSRRYCGIQVTLGTGTHHGPCVDLVEREEREPAPVSRRQRRCARRQARATLRAQAPVTRAAARARRGAREGLPQTARTLLVAAGVPDGTAGRYAAAFSRGVPADATRCMRVPMGRSGVTERQKVKLYGPDTFAARLSTYRPRNAEHAAAFAAAAR